MPQTFVGQVTIKAVLKYKDSFVLVKEDNEEKWILPGGRMDFSETPEDTLRREVKEELGVEISHIVLQSVGETGEGNRQGKDAKSAKIFIFYTAKILPDQEISKNSEIVDFALVSKKSELENYPMYQNQKREIEKFLN